MITIALINLKGGTAKTTSAAFIAHVLHEMGLRTLAVDADAENESLMGWQQDAAWPVSVVALPVTNLHKQVAGLIGEPPDPPRFDAVVIDSPPVRERRAVALSAARAATHVIVPMAPTPIEYQRLPAVRKLLDDAADLRPDGKRPAFAVLLTRAVAGAASTAVYRDQITEDGDWVLRTTVGRLERFSQAYGLPIRNAINTAYGDAVAELLDLEAAA